MKKILLVFALFLSGISFAQNINEYKYLIVPDKFEFLKEQNKYNLNELTKMVFEKYGFIVFYPNDKMPDELLLNKCKALYGDIENDSGMMNTAIFITIKDCSGKLLFKSEKGKSKIKDYKKAYYEALREAAASLAGLNYKYDPTAIEAAPQTPVQPVTPAVVHTQEVKPIAIKKDETLFAQPITNGYQLVDTTPKVVLRLYKTSNPDSFTAVTDGRNGIVFKKGNDWIFEYYQNEQLVTEKLNIKF